MVGVAVQFCSPARLWRCVPGPGPAGPPPLRIFATGTVSQDRNVRCRSVCDTANLITLDKLKLN